MKTVSKTIIGVDYGTQSARAVLVSVDNGEILHSCRREYPHSGTPVPALDCAENLPVQRTMRRHYMNCCAR